MNILLLSVSAMLWAQVTENSLKSLLTINQSIGLIIPSIIQYKISDFVLLFKIWLVPFQAAKQERTGNKNFPIDIFIFIRERKSSRGKKYYLTSHWLEGLCPPLHRFQCKWNRNVVTNSNHCFGLCRSFPF